MSSGKIYQLLLQIATDVKLSPYQVGGDHRHRIAPTGQPRRDCPYNTFIQGRI
jgi:hypothetical protein